MPSERSLRVLQDILRQIDLSFSFVGNLDAEEFERDTLRTYAVTRCLEIISEASRRLPKEIRERHPHIPWRDIAGSGNIYRHDYEEVAPQRLWATVWRALPILKEVIEKELAMPD
jgi:uncharacterized protein with HEPN domain